ncbi:MAG: Protoheme IX farnesyltransferase, mitochondrial [Bathelium mastoideum]|nr:MAG: Protoheme IX farnesyltransferase, mitochondrial [Bathelium mastoideum]
MILRPCPRAPLINHEASNVCSQCLRKLYGTPLRSKRPLSSTYSTRVASSGIQPKKSAFKREYFSANNLLRDVLFSTRDGRQEDENDRRRPPDLPPSSPKAKVASIVGLAHDATIDSSLPSNTQPSAGAPLPDTSDLPHRRRKRLKQAQEQAHADHTIPPDASSRLSTLSSSLPTDSLRRRLAAYLSLSKPRLSFLIVLTTTASYAIYPMPTILLPSATAAPSLSPLILLFLTTGTALASASANALNMLYEPDSDAKMTRTRNRPLVRGLLSRRAALLFAAATAATGTLALYYGVNPTVAALGLANIVLYAGVYTPLKRLSVLNTWAGALVGAIPPLMGWAAAAGQCASSYRSADGVLVPEPGWQELLLAPDGSSVGGWLLAALLFAWQFPHFNALSHSIREEYRTAGMRMLCWVSPKANARIAFRYALFMFPICFGLSYYGITDWGFVATSGVVNTWMMVEAWKFWKRTGERGSARGLFWASVWHLPIVLVLAMAHKKGLWERVWNGAFGQSLEYDADDGAEEENEHDRAAWTNPDRRQGLRA